MEAQPPTLTSDELLDQAARLVGKEVYVKGKVTHVCHNSGKKVFLATGDENKTIQVFADANGNIEKFSTDLIGKQIGAKGIVAEHRISKETIDKQEKEIAAELEKEDCMNVERCNNVMSNYKKMQAWIAANKTDYYPIYFVKATSYDVLK
ncbi:hypothetical protein JCM15124A_16590 [Prevotella falsenii]